MNIKDLDKFKKNLKKYQHNAALMCIKYLSSESTQNALVHLPTGERVIIVTGCNKCFKIKGFKNFIKEIHALLRAINL